MRRWMVLTAAAAAIAGGAFTVLQEDPYELQILTPTAAGSFVGARTLIAGQDVGHVKAVGVQGDRAKITVAIDKEYAPLHAGTTARIRWNSLIGRRMVELQPGPEANPALPSGKLITSNGERVELDDILAALDAPTRKKVQQLVGQLQQTLGGSAGDLKATLNAAGPFVQALGEVLRGVGQDGPAIRSLVSQLHGITQTLADRDTELAGTVRNLSSLVASASRQQEQLKAALAEAPSTVREGTKFFTRVPGAVDATLPLVEDLRPVTRQLPEVAANLNPVLTDLRPTVAALRRTLSAAQSLLQYTPGLLDSAHATLPGVQDAASSVQPAVAFLRPYTPELIGFLSNWTSLFSAKNASGHFGRANVIASATSFDDNPGVLPPGLTQDPAPTPGSLVGQPWTDANGDGVR